MTDGTSREGSGVWLGEGASWDIKDRRSYDRSTWMRRGRAGGTAGGNDVAIPQR